MNVTCADALSAPWCLEWFHRDIYSNIEQSEHKSFYIFVLFNNSFVIRCDVLRAIISICKSDAAHKNATVRLLNWAITRDIQQQDEMDHNVGRINEFVLEFNK